MNDFLIGAPDPLIVSLEERLRQAQLDADVAALDELIAEPLLFAGPDGNVASKSDDLAAHGSGVVRFREHQPEELRIRRIGDAVAITSLRARLAVEVSGVLHRGVFRYTRVWAREADGRWRVAGGHVSQVADSLA
jgi:ketosteroid isomerase-like protein